MRLILLGGPLHGTSQWVDPEMAVFQFPEPVEPRVCTDPPETKVHAYRVDSLRIGSYGFAFLRHELLIGEEAFRAAVQFVAGQLEETGDAPQYPKTKGTVNVLSQAIDAWIENQPRVGFENRVTPAKDGA